MDMDEPNGSRIRFDIARPRISTRAAAYAVFAVVLAVIVLASGGPGGAADIVLLFLLGLEIPSLFELILWFERRSNAKRLREARVARPDTLYVGFGQSCGFVLANGTGFGPVTLAKRGLTYGAGRKPEFPAPLEIDWEDVEAVTFLPRLQPRGKLQLRLRGGSRLSWWIRADCNAAFAALATIRDSN